MKKLWIEAVVTVPQEAAEAVGYFLSNLTGRGVVMESLPPDSGDEPWRERIRAYFSEEEVLSSSLGQLLRYLADLEETFPGVLKWPVETRLLFEEDWTRGLKELFAPRRLGKKIVVKPSWEVYIPRRGDIVVEIDPGLAFGTGSHPSTYLVIELLEDLFEKGLSCPYVLDVGTGTGILAICAAKLGAKAVVGIDIDPEAAEVARNNVLKNDVHRRVTITTSPVFQLADLFDLVLANIGAYELELLAPDIARHLKTGGLAILSGILKEQREGLVETYGRHNFLLLEERIDKEFGEWTALVLRKMA